MASLKPRFWVFVLSITFVSAQFRVSSGAQTTEEAYATLLYSDEFLLGVRVLGKSIRDSGTDKDMVVLASDGVSDYSKKLLEADGWKVKETSIVPNPNHNVGPKRLWGIYTKLKIFNLTDYKKVVYLDGDTTVVKNIDDLFKCSKFCANLEHSERFNAGVLVVEPSESLFNDMMSKVKTLPSYTGGDQGFLNSYYPDFPNARLFDPSVPVEVLKTRPVPEMQRLSTLYNAKVVQYMISNKWKIDENQIHVLHYTIGPFKPWDWWASWLVKPVESWQSIRAGLEESLPGTGGGKNPKDELTIKFLFFLPLCALFFCLYRSTFQGCEFLESVRRSFVCSHIRHPCYKSRCNGALGYTGVSTLPTTNSNYQPSNSAYSNVPRFLGTVSILVCFAAAMTSIEISFAIVPRQIMPWTGLLLTYEWTFAIFFLLFGGFLVLVHRYAKTIAIQTGSLSSHIESSLDDSGKGHQRIGVSCEITTLYYGLGMAFLAVAVFSLPYILGITAIFSRICMMVAAAIVLASFMTHASENLAIRWFLKGLERP